MARALAQVPAKREPSCLSIVIVNGMVVNVVWPVGSMCSETLERSTTSVVPVHLPLRSGTSLYADAIVPGASKAATIIPAPISRVTMTSLLWLE